MLHSASDDITFGYLSENSSNEYEISKIKKWPTSATYQNAVMTSQFVFRIYFEGVVHASVYECWLVLYFWYEAHPLLIISYDQYISFILATPTQVMKFLSLLSQDY